MDVKCERCNTEYEFDDALVSGRGTTVKCTNCGHKFKIRRSDGDFSEDFWNVTTGDGRTLVFTSLRELQRAIQGYLVERNDRLSRGGLPQKPIGQIPELAPFFEQREAAKKQQAGAGRGERAVKTQDGLGPAAANAQKEIQTQVGVPGNPAGRPRQATKPDFPAPPASENFGKTTLIGTGFDDATGAAPPKTERQPEPSFDGGSTAPMPDRAPPALATAARVATQPPPAARPNTTPIARPTPPPPVPSIKPAVHAQPSAHPSAQPPPGVRTMVSQPPPLPDRPRRPSAPSHPHISVAPPVPERARRDSGGARIADAGRPLPPPTINPNGNLNDPLSSDRLIAAAPSIEVSSPLPPAARARSLLAEIDEEHRARGHYAGDDDDVRPPRRSVGGFVVATVVVGCLLLLGAVWAQKNLGLTLGTKPAPPAPTVDPRVAGFLTTGEKALSDGNLDSAMSSFDKASALAEKDPHVLLDVARLAALRADELWLKSRLLPADATDEHRITRDGLVDLAGRARKAADDALAVAPDEPAALRAKIDALRISGDRDGARAMVGKITANASQPESSYVLAALDLAELEPLWPTVIERLKTAANVETGPGRARAALVYALARSGDAPAAKAEVERLAAMAKPHPLLPLLRAFADHAPSKVAAGAGKDGGAEVAAEGDAGPVAVVPGKGIRPGTNTGTGTFTWGSGDTRDLVSQAEKARVRGEYERAKTLFNQAIQKNPQDSEALAGLGSIAYAQRDLPGARAAYKQVLTINPNYMPALVGLADVEWESGDKATATKMYKDITDRYPEGAYPARVKQRSEGGG